MDEIEAEARPVMGTIFLVSLVIRDSQLNRPESVSLANYNSAYPSVSTQGTHAQ